MYMIIHVYLLYIIMLNMATHYDVIKRKHFPRYWPFVGGIHRWPVTGGFPPQTASDTCFDVFLDVSLNIRVRVIWDAVKYMCIFPRIYELRLWWHQPSPWWRQNVETVSALLVFCEGKPPMIDGLPGHAVLWSFFLLVCANPSIIWDALTVMWFTVNLVLCKDMSLFPTISIKWTIVWLG